MNKYQIPYRANFTTTSLFSAMKTAGVQADNCYPFSVGCAGILM